MKRKIIILFLFLLIVFLVVTLRNIYYCGVRGDLAERMPLSEIAINGDMKPQSAEVVEIDRYGFIVRSSKAESPYVVGVVSTKPAHILRNMIKESVPVALSGIVPCKITDENGTIVPGDLLISSSKPGYAMRAYNKVKPGTVIGKAMDSQENSEDIIPILVMLR